MHSLRQPEYQRKAAGRSAETVEENILVFRRGFYVKQQC